MSQLSLHGASAFRDPIDESLRAQGGSDSESDRRSSLTAPKSFFGHQITVHTVTEHYDAALHHLNELEELRARSFTGEELPRNFPQRIRALEARAQFHALLAKETEESLLDETTSHLSLPSDEELPPEELLAEEDSVVHEIPSSVTSFLPPEPPPAFFGNAGTNNFSTPERKQRQNFRAMAAHEEKAKQYLRQIRNAKKFIVLLKERGNLLQARVQKEFLKELTNHADYHIAMAQTIHAQICGYDPNSPGAHAVVSQGNYEIEFPVSSTSPPRKAQEIKNPKENLIQLQKTKAIPVASAQIVQPAKSSTGSKQALPVAKKIRNKEVTATFPKNIRLPEAKVTAV